MNYPTAGFYGTGNMAGAIIQGLIRSGWPAKCIIACRRDRNKLGKLANLNIVTTTDGLQLVKSCDILILGVKPWQIEDICHQLRAHLKRETTVVSIAAGIAHPKIASILDNNWVVRAMPNMPVVLGHGITALFSTQENHAGTRMVADLFGRVGYCFHLVNEDDIHAVIAISGSGPAYYFHIMSLMKRVAGKLGMNEKTASLLVANTMTGAAFMAQNNHNFEQLRDQVVSKGGTTEAALKQFDDHNLAEAIEAALTACRDKSQELSK